MNEKMDEEEMIRRITRMMEIGGTMLAEHHDCGAPLFRYKGEIICPVCSVSERVEQETTGRVPEEEKRVSEKHPSESTVQVGVTSSMGSHDEKECLAVVRSSLHAKLRELCKGIANEQDLSSLKSKLECIEIAIRALKQL